MILEKDGVKIELTKQGHIDAYKQAGYTPVETKKSRPKKEAVTEEQ